MIMIQNESDEEEYWDVHADEINDNFTESTLELPAPEKSSLISLMIVML